MAEHTELRECPFCGGEASIEYLPGWEPGIADKSQAVVRCVSAACNQWTYATPERAIEKWNTRAPDPSHADLVAALEAAHVVIDMLAKQLADLDVKCSPLDALQFVQARELRDTALTKAGER